MALHPQWGYLKLECWWKWVPPLSPSLRYGSDVTWPVQNFGREAGETNPKQLGLKKDEIWVCVFVWVTFRGSNWEVSLIHTHYDWKT